MSKSKMCSYYKTSHQEPGNDYRYHGDDGRDDDNDDDNMMML